MAMSRRPGLPFELKTSDPASGPSRRGYIVTRDQLQILENQLVANCQYKGVQTTLHKLLESLFEGKDLDSILAELLE
jgi:hypothetical protein